MHNGFLMVLMMIFLVGWFNIYIYILYQIHMNALCRNIFLALNPHISFLPMLCFRPAPSAQRCFRHPSGPGVGQEPPRGALLPAPADGGRPWPTWVDVLVSVSCGYNKCLVGGDWNMTFIVSIYWDVHHPNWLSYVSEELKPPTRCHMGTTLYLLIGVDMANHVTIGCGLSGSSYLHVDD